MSLTLKKDLKNDKDASYLKTIMFLLDKMRLDTDRPPYEPDVFDATAISWKEHLQRHKVPGSLLFDLYLSAISYRSKIDKRGSFCIEDMLGAWFRYKEDLQYAEQTKPSNLRTCNKCRGNGGYIIASLNGKTIEVKCSHHAGK